MHLIELMSDEELKQDVNDTNDIGPVFSLDTEEDADECLSKILWANRKIEENNKLVEKKKKQLETLLKDYEDSLNKKLENYRSIHEDLLREWMINRFGNIKKSAKLLHGTVRMKEDTGRTAVDDEGQLIDFIKANNLQDKCVTIKESVRKSDFKKLFEKDQSGHYFVDKAGNIIPGIHIDKSDDLQLSIRPAKTEGAA